HYVDRYVLGDGKAFGNYGDDLYQVMKNSPTIQALVKGDIPGVGAFADDAMTRQLYKGEEMFARAFEQYIAERSGNHYLLDQLAKAQVDPTLRAEVWQADEFKPIAEP